MKQLSYKEVIAHLAKYSIADRRYKRFTYYKLKGITKEQYKYQIQLFAELFQVDVKQLHNHIMFKLEGDRRNNV